MTGSPEAQDERRCNTCRTTVEECMRLRDGRPMQFCCGDCAVIGSHYDADGASGGAS